MKLTQQGAIAAFGRRSVNDVVRAAFAKAGDHWGRNFLLKHFTKAGAREYDYAPRKGEHARAGSKRFKRIAGPAERRAGEILPLVYSGELKREASTYRVTAKATSKTAYAHVALPRANKANRLATKFRGELHRVSKAEWQVLTRLINRAILAGLNRLPARKHKKIA